MMFGQAAATPMFGTSNTIFSNPRDFITVDTGGPDVVTCQIQGFSHQVTDSAFEVILMLPCSCASMVVAGHFKRTGEKTVFPSVMVASCLAGVNGLDESGPVYQFREASCFRTLDFRTCRFELCDWSLKGGAPISMPQPPSFSFGTTNTTSPQALAPNTIMMKFLASTLVMSEALSKRDARWMPDLGRSPQRHDLPWFPGVSLVRSFDRNLSFCIHWNMFAMSFDKRTYWLYPRRIRLIFRTLLMIRKFRDHSGLGRLDMNVMRIIFNQIATPRPLWLPLLEHELVLASEQQRFVELQAEDPKDPMPSFTFGGTAVKGGFTFGTAQPAFGQNAGAPALAFGAAPSPFNFGTAQAVPPAAPVFNIPNLAAVKPAEVAKTAKDDDEDEDL